MTVPAAPEKRAASRGYVNRSVDTLLDAMGKQLARRDKEIIALQKRIADLEEAATKP